MVGRVPGGGCHKWLFVGFLVLFWRWKNQRLAIKVSNFDIGLEKIDQGVASFRKIVNESHPVFLEVFKLCAVSPYS